MIDSHRQATEAYELALASAVMLDPSCLDSFPEFSANDMRDEFSALIVGTTQRLHQDGEAVDLYRVMESLDRSGVLAEKCGPDAVGRMVALAQAPLTGDPVSIARDIHQGAQRRRFRMRLEALVAGVDDPTVSLEALSRQISAAGELLGEQWSGIESLTSAELDAGEFEMSYHIEDVLPADQPTILAAPKKCCKTNVAIDMNLSLASAAKFLGVFYIRKAVNSALVSGESGKPVIQETARRIARAKPWVHLQDYTRAHWSFDLPQLSDHRSLMALRQFIRKHHLDVLILDPVYLMLCLGDDAGNLFKVGPILYSLAKMAADERVTLLLLHHLVKTVGVTDGPPELESMSWAGFQEFARAWILMARRSKYDTEQPGHHEFWFATGGSAGHSIGKAIDIDEGQRKDHGGRRWDVTVRGIGDVIGEKIEAAETAKEQRKLAQHERAVKEAMAGVIAALDGKPDGLTARRLKDDFNIRGPAMTAAVKELIKAAKVVECEIVAANKQPYSGWKLAKYSAGNTGQHRADAQSCSVLPNDQHTVGGAHPPIGGAPGPVCVAVAKP